MEESDSDLIEVHAWNSEKNLRETENLGLISGDPIDSRISHLTNGM
jgi:hypothetical protein